MSDPPNSYPNVHPQGKVAPSPEPGGALTAAAGQRAQRHLAELCHIDSLNSFRSEFIQHAKLSAPVSLANYVWRTVTSFVKAAMIWPATIFLDPLSTLATLFVYPFIFVGLGIATVVLWALSTFGGNCLLEWASNRWANGYSIINWANPQMLEGLESARVVTSARATLAEIPTTFHDVPAPGETNVDFTPSTTTRIFDLDVAKTLLIMSSLVYERIDKKVTEAATLAATDLVEAEKVLLDSEKIIRTQAEAWRLRYEGISDLASTGGPFASVFYTEQGDEAPFIILCFKGTTPYNFAEFLIDATISRSSASVFFGDGTAHQGFYSDLFPTTEGGADGYGQIVRSLKHIASDMSRDGRQEPIPLWITGHSLGSALATLAYARFLRMPEDLGPQIDLRDAYCYGTPRLGDGKFASKFEETTVTPVGRPNILWRVVNNFDIVTRVPLGLADSESYRTFFSPVAILDYAHLGTCVCLTPRKAPYYKVNPFAFHQATRVVVVKDGGQGKKANSRLDSLEQAGWNPLRCLLALLPPPIFDHFPSSYYTHLNQMEVLCQGGGARRSADVAGANKKQA